MRQKKSIEHNQQRVVVFDIETEPFTEEFRRAKSASARLKCCPKMRLAGMYNALTGKYSFYTPTDCAELIRELSKADTIITFNGNQFDFLVLRRHSGLSKSALQEMQRKHIDLYEVVRLKTGCSYKLDQLAHENLNERKKVHGREMWRLSLAELKDANRSDLSQTYRLWQKWEYDTLIYPYRRVRFDHDDIAGGSHSQLPPGYYIDLDTEDMTEGQMAEYMAGTWGITPDGRFIEM